MWKTLQTTAVAVIFGISLQGAEATPKVGGIAFRFDDNQPIERWQKMAAVFEKHGFRFCMSINALDASRKAGYPEFLAKMAKNGYEVMDHTPEHTIVKLALPTQEAAEKLAKEEYVHHVAGNVVYFNFLFDKTHPSCRPWTISVDGKKVTVIDGKWDKSDVSRYIVFPDGTIYLFALHGKQPVLLNQFGEDKVNLPKTENVKVVIASRNAFQVDDRALAQIAKRSRELFLEMKLPAPRTFVTPGGWGLYPPVEQVSRVYGKQFNYAAGDVFEPNWSSTYSGRSFHRFCMSPFWNSLENLDVEKEKKVFANLLAKNYVIPVISHMWLHNLNNDFDKLLQRYDEFLAWVKAKQIPVHNMAEWADILYDGKSDPAWNIFPSLTRDLNEDNCPDGYDNIGKDATLKNGELSGTGICFYISSLSGFTPGKNTLSLEGKSLNGKKTKLVMVFHLCDGSSRNSRKNLTISIPFQESGEFKKYERTFEIPAWVAGSHVTCLIDGEGVIRNLSLRAGQIQ